MNFKKIAVIGVLTFFVISCSVTKLQQAGNVDPQIFHSKLGFITSKTVIVLKAQIDGMDRNFLFDTGADLSIIQRDTTIGKTAKYSGASKRKMKLGEEVLSSIGIGDVSFNNTNALNADLVGLKDQIPDFGGIIGQPIISKANWLIDYPKNRLELSNKQLADSSFNSIEIIREDGAPYTFIIVKDKKYKVIIDFGSSSTINIPDGSAFAKDIMNSIILSDNQRERYTLGGLQIIKEKVGIIPKVKLGDFEFLDVNVNINTSSQARIGISFFKDYVVYIDNINKVYKIKKAN